MNKPLARLSPTQEPRIRVGSDPLGIRRRYGTLRGLARLMLSQAYGISGGFRAYSRPAWWSADRLVFVCRGNICRSAYAERKAVAEGLPASSFGLYTSNGRPAPDEAIAVAAQRGVGLESHRSRAIAEFELRPNDLLIAMEPGQAWELSSRFPGHAVTLLGLWSQPWRPHLHDPYYTLTEDYFQTCFSIIDSAIAAMMVRKNASR